MAINLAPQNNSITSAFWSHHFYHSWIGNVDLYSKNYRLCFGRWQQKTIIFTKHIDDWRRYFAKLHRQSKKHFCHENWAID